VANVVYCRFCGASITFVRSNLAATPVTAWAPIPVNWPAAVTAPAAATTFRPSAGHVDHARTCPRASKWTRQAGHVLGIVTRPDNVGSI